MSAIWPETASVVSQRCAPFDEGEIVTIEDFYRAEGDYRAAWVRSERDPRKVGPVPASILVRVAR